MGLLRLKTTLTLLSKTKDVKFVFANNLFKSPILAVSSRTICAAHCAGSTNLTKNTAKPQVIHSQLVKTFQLRQFQWGEQIVSEQRKEQ